MAHEAQKPDNRADGDSEASEMTGLLSSADEYIDALERKLRFDILENPWNRAWAPSQNEIASKKAAWLANKSVAELKGR